MTAFTYARDIKHYLENAWDYAHVAFGDYAQLHNELHLVGIPIDTPYQNCFAFLLANAYAHEPWPDLALRWDEVLKCAKSEEAFHYVNAVHSYCEHKGVLPEVYTQTFYDWVAFYARGLNHDVIAFDDFSRKPVSAQRSAHLVAAQKWLQMSHKGSFYHDLLMGGHELPYEAYSRGMRLFEAAEVSPQYALLLSMACIYPEVSANLRTGQLPPEREEKQFCMSRTEFAKPIRGWLSDKQPQALTWLEQLEERVLLCNNLDTQAAVAVPLLMTRDSPVHSGDAADPFSIARGLFREIGFYGNSITHNTGEPLPRDLNFDV